MLQIRDYYGIYYFKGFLYIYNELLWGEKLMRKNRIGTIIVMLGILLLTSCKSDTSKQVLEENVQLLEENIQVLEKENKSMKSEIEMLNKDIENLNNQLSDAYDKLYDIGGGITINYVTPTYKKRFVEKGTNILSLPREGSIPLNRIRPNTLVYVIDVGTSDYKEFWLYVSIPVYDCPANYKGWIKESDTVPFTKENQKDVQSDVTVPKGTKIYEDCSFEEIPNTTPIILEYNDGGRLEERRNNYVRIQAIGGRDFWVEEKYVVFPPVDI